MRGHQVQSQKRIDSTIAIGAPGPTGRTGRGWSHSRFWARAVPNPRLSAPRLPLDQLVVASQRRLRPRGGDTGGPCRFHGSAGFECAWTVPQLNGSDARTGEGRSERSRARRRPAPVMADRVRQAAERAPVVSATTGTTQRSPLESPDQNSMPSPRQCREHCGLRRRAAASAAGWVSGVSPVGSPPRGLGPAFRAVQWTFGYPEPTDSP